MSKAGDTGTATNGQLRRSASRRHFFASFSCRAARCGTGKGAISVDDVFVIVCHPAPVSRQPLHPCK